MRVMMVSKALVVGAYQKKAEELAAFEDVELTVVVPPYWRSSSYVQRLEPEYTNGYQVRVMAAAFNGHFHWHYYPGFRHVLQELRPDVVHVDEEPYNFATVHAIWQSRHVGARTLFFTWQNIFRRLPPPFSLFEAYCYKVADYAIAGNAEAVSVLRCKGYGGPAGTIPQFGIDPTIYAFRQAVQGGPLRIGYLGRFVEEKGLDSLLDAVSDLAGDWKLRFVGDGPIGARLRERALALDGRVTISPTVASVEVPKILAELDVLVLPSITSKSWKEQFGRVLVEAMACGVAVVGSSSGEIPNVIGPAGVVFPEGNVAALRAALAMLRDNPTERQRLARAGRERALERFTQRSVAAQTVAIYRELMNSARRP